MTGEYISLFLTFIAGGGLSTLITARYTRKGAQIDANDKAANFWQGQFDTITSRHIELEKKYDELKLMIEERAPLICYNAPRCEKRQRAELKTKITG